LFEASGAQVTVRLAENGSQIQAFARQAVDEGASIVVAAGGDGTVNAVATILVGTSTVLGVLPLGTLNHFAKDVGVPTDLEAAVKNLVNGRAVRVDVGQINSRFFLNNSSLGLYPSIVREREGLQRKGLGKWFSLLLGSFQVLLRYRRLYIKFHAGDQPEVEEETPFVFVGNNQYQVSGFRLGARDRLDAGKLWIYRAPKASRLAMFGIFLRALLGWHTRGELRTFATEKLCIRTGKHHIHVATDGEVQTMQGPLNYGILPRALNVIVPSASSAGAS